MKTKIISTAILVISLCSFVLAAQLDFSPQYADVRFTPAETFHAGCLNVLDVEINPQSESLITSRLVVSFDPEIVQVISSKADKNQKGLVDVNIAYDQIVVNVGDTQWTGKQNIPVVQIVFKVAENTKKASFWLGSGSYVMTTKGQKIALSRKREFAFAKAQECEPDVLPPTITLIKPKTTSTPISLDGYFLFLLKDLGKGVDKENIKIFFDGKTYTGKNIVRDGDYVGFYPPKWINPSKDLELSIKVGDKQIYGGPNYTKKTFMFRSATGIVFENSVTPEIWRKINQKAYQIFATPEECEILATLKNSKTSAMMQKFGCDENSQKPIISQEINETTTSSKSYVSAFAVLGWLLFSIALLLKLHYYMAYRKHKKN